MPFSFLCANILKDLCLIATGGGCANGTPISKNSVGTSADAARMSAYATMISTFYRSSPKTKRHWRKSACATRVGQS